MRPTHDGFDTTELSGIAVQETHTSSANVSLQVGQATTSIEVESNLLPNATDATNSYTLDDEQVALTPLATGSFTRLAVLSPGLSGELLAILIHPAWQPAYLC
jgi:hypothetical protein